MRYLSSLRPTKCDTVANGLVMTLMADVDDLKTFAGSYFGLVMDFGHQGANGVHHIATVCLCCGHDFRRRAVSAEHEGRAGRYFLDGFHKDHAEFFESVDHQAVVHDLVVAVDWCIKHANHPGESLDGHLHACAKSAGCSEQNAINFHCPPTYRPSGR